MTLPNQTIQRLVCYELKLFQKSCFTLSSCPILIQINFCIETSPKGLTQGALQ